MRPHLQAWAKINHKGMWKPQAQLRFLTFSVLPFDAFHHATHQPLCLVLPCVQSCSLYVTQFQEVGYSSTKQFKIHGTWNLSHGRRVSVCL